MLRKRRTHIWIPFVLATLFVIALCKQAPGRVITLHEEAINAITVTKSQGDASSRQELSAIYQDFQDNLHEKRSGAGILLFAYGSDSQTYENFASQVVEAARLFKRHSPKVRLALATSQGKSVFDELFETVILIQNIHNFRGGNYQKRADGLDRQWLTRILYLTATPFETTIAYDANVAACGPIDDALFRLSMADFDFAAASRSPQSSLSADLNPHNFALAYKWNPVVSLLFERWFQQQLKSGVANDDQHTLQRVITKLAKERPDFRVKTLNPSIAAAFISTQSSAGFFPRETRVIHGSVIVVHENPNRGDAACAQFNAHAPTKRQIVRLETFVDTAFDSSICASLINRTACKYSALWNDSGESALVPSLVH